MSRTIINLAIGVLCGRIGWAPMAGPVTKPAEELPRRSNTIHKTAAVGITWGFGLA